MQKKIVRCNIRLTVAVLVLTVAGLLSVQTICSAKVVDRIVAIVNDELITLSDVNEAVKPYLNRLEQQNYPFDKEMEMRFKIREDVIDQLINKKISDQRIEKANINVSEGEVDNAIENIKQGNSFTDEQLRDLLEKEGITLEDYRENVKEQLLRTKLVNYEVKSKIVITEEDMGNWYARNAEKVDNQPFNEVKNRVRDILYREKGETKFKEWIDSLRSEAHIKIIH